MEGAWPAAQLPKERERETADPGLVGGVAADVRLPHVTGNPGVTTGTARLGSRGSGGYFRRAERLEHILRLLSRCTTTWSSVTR